MTEETIAILLSHPLAVAALSAIIAGVTAALTVKMLIRSPEADAAPAAVASSGAASRADAAAAAPAPDNRAIIAAIAGAVAASGAHRVVYIGEAPTVSGWATELRARHHSSHTPYYSN
jgi:hypothetical protein